MRVEHFNDHYFVWLSKADLYHLSNVFDDEKQIHQAMLLQSGGDISVLASKDYITTVKEEMEDKIIYPEVKREVNE
jgi:hypothetical protein